VGYELVEGLPDFDLRRHVVQENPPRNGPHALLSGRLARDRRAGRAAVQEEETPPRQDARHGAHHARVGRRGGAHVIADARSARNRIEVALECLRDLLLGLRSQDDARARIHPRIARLHRQMEKNLFAGLLEFPRRAAAARQDGRTAPHTLYGQRVMRSMAGMSFPRSSMTATEGPPLARHGGGRRRSRGRGTGDGDG
jgi:hypothetical protein